jgi:hypothetical protein
LVVASVLAVGLVGCGGQTEIERGEYTIYVHGGSLLPRGGEDALIEGALIMRDGCVLIDRGGGFDIAFPVIWPSGTSIASDDPLTLRLPSGDELVVGQVVSGGGGYHDAASDRVQVSIPAACVPETGEVAIFNPDVDLTVDAS